MTVMISTLEAPSQIQGIHGGAGAMQWKSLAPTSAMAGDWYSLEYAVLPSGVEAGLHTHTRTEELWLVTDGQAIATLGDQKIEASPGSVLLTSIFGTHGQRQIGDIPYTFAIALVFPPIVASTLLPLMPTRTASQGSLMMALQAKQQLKTQEFKDARYHHANLYELAKPVNAVYGGRGSGLVGEVSPEILRQVFDADWRAIQWISLDQNSTLGPRTLSDSEVMILITKGQGIIHSDDMDIQLANHQSATFPQTAVLHLEQQGDEPLELFLIELGIAETQL
jgi:mannose-6-phosphate isomerase-like protein (cupin superfamily)